MIISQDKGTFWTLSAYNKCNCAKEEQYGIWQRMLLMRSLSFSM